ncbi:MAG: dephospho-CoA kinase [Alphaproteobacteria bacterium]|nr:dephospho-CoA kinase [Alphaproteobacteria bacterium]
MWVLGLTGLMGSGKSTIATFLRREGVPVQCADEEIHELLNSDKDIHQKIKRMWPDVFENGKINRIVLGDKILFYHHGLEKLEEILYPKLILRQKKFLQKNQKDRSPVVALDIPLLFEVGLDRYCHRIILAHAPLFLRKQRVLRRKGMTLEKFLYFDSHHMGEEEKIRKANFIILCGRDKGSVLRKVQEILHSLYQEPIPKWGGLWPTQLLRKSYGKRNCFRYRNNRV